MRTWVTVLIGVVLFLGGFGLSTLYSGSVPVDATVQDHSAPRGAFSVLLLGIDARPSQTTGRTDTIVVATVNPRARRITFLSVPRDTRIDMAGHGVQKINAANEFGGPVLAVHEVNRLLGSAIHYYVLTNFGGFKEIVDTLGGVTIDVPEPMHYRGGKNTYINLSAGLQHLDGTQALEFVRYREFRLGDIQRTLDQQALLKAILKQALRPSTIPRLPSLIPQFRSAVHTNMSNAQLLGFLDQVRALESGHMLSETLPGAFLNVPGASYWQVIPADAHRYYEALLRGKRASSLFDPAAVALAHQREGAAARAATGNTSAAAAAKTSGGASTSAAASGTSGSRSAHAAKSGVSSVPSIRAQVPQKIRSMTPQGGTTSSTTYGSGTTRTSGAGP